MNKFHFITFFTTVLSFSFIIYTVAARSFGIVQVFTNHLIMWFDHLLIHLIVIRMTEISFILSKLYRTKKRGTTGKGTELFRSSTTATKLLKQIILIIRRLPYLIFRVNALGKKNKVLVYVSSSRIQSRNKNSWFTVHCCRQMVGAPCTPRFLNIGVSCSNTS